MLFCREGGDLTIRPVIKPRGELSMLVAKKGPLQKAAVAHDFFS
jgi:hypothetical protein